MKGTTFKRVITKPFTTPTSPPTENPCGKRKRRRHACVDAERRHHTRQSDRRPDSEIDPAADDDQRHTDRADRNDHRLRKNDAQVVWRKKPRGCVHQQREDADDEQQTERWSNTVQPALHDGAHSRSARFCFTSATISHKEAQKAQDFISDTGPVADATEFLLPASPCSLSSPASRPYRSSSRRCARAGYRPSSSRPGNPC